MSSNKKPLVFVVGVTLAAILLFMSYNVEAVRYCDGDLLKENITVDDTVISIELDDCLNGCESETWLTLGQPGCVETDIQIILIGIVIMILFILLMRFFL